VHTVKKGAKWAAQIWRIARSSWDITLKYARCLFISVALPRILYAVDLWCTPVNKTHARPKGRGSAKVMKQITTIQRAAALAITGGLKTSPNDMLNSCAFLPPAVLTINKWCFRVYIRMLMLPKVHPLHRTVTCKNNYNTKRHHSPIHNLAQNYKINAKRLKKIPATAHNPASAGKLLFQINNPENREDSTKRAENTKEEIQIFTDGSAINSKVGAAALLTRPGKPMWMLHYHLGRDSEHTVHEVELIGILLAICLVKTEKRGHTSIVIGCDNQAAIRAFQTELRNLGQHLTQEILRSANKLVKRGKKNKYSLTIRWTARHEGIVGNKLADQEAKKAADGLSSKKLTLLHYLRKPLLINPSTVKQDHNARLKKAWTNEWCNSERGRKMLKIDNSTLSNKFIKLISNSDLSHNVASTIAQLRITHMPLNSYLKRCKRTGSSRCPACGAENESISHFLLICPSYAHERWLLHR